METDQYQVGEEMPTLSKEFLDKIESETEQIIQSCQQLKQDFPEEKFSYAVGGEVVVATFLKVKARTILGLENIDSVNREEKTKEIRAALIVAYEWVILGSIIIQERYGSDFLENYPAAYFINVTEQEYAKKSIYEPFHLAYYLLCLVGISNYEYLHLQSYADKQEFENPEKSGFLYRQSIDAQGHLMCAQVAAELGSASIEQAFGNERFIQQQSIIDELQEYAEFGKGKKKIEKRNKNISKEAKEFWRPHILDVHNLVEKGRTISNAAKIVADKNELNCGTLRNNYNKWKKEKTV